MTYVKAKKDSKKGLCPKCRIYERAPNIINHTVNVVGEECMADFTAKESSCLAGDVFTRRDHYHCGPDKAVKKCDTLLSIHHEA